VNYRLFKHLMCPACRRALHLEGGYDEATDQKTLGTYKGGEIVSGQLSCDCGRAYPVIDGVPRFVDQASNAGKNSAASDYSSNHGTNGAGDDYDNIRKSFSQEWGLFNYDSDKTWGWNLDERKKIFLGDVGFQPSQLEGKTLLDGGCGNGTLSAALTSFGLEVVGLDLNDGLGRAYANRSKYIPQDLVDRVQYVQGNLVDPPLRPGSFDLVYSSGVIHHTPNSKLAFSRLQQMTVSGGRLYVWVYAKRSWPVRVFFAVGRNLKRWISLKAVLKVCQILAPIHKLAAIVLSRLGLMQFRARTTREITLDLFDLFAPRYNHVHTETEVRGWFQEHGFDNIELAGVQKHGFGMHGDKVASPK
jgi:2-polyprenyl-3-methyl-5-hydroxy-6-metoxy-1,4-benzoquinol methylase